MSTLAAAFTTGGALFALGLATLVLRRSFLGMLIGVVLGMNGLILLAVALFVLTGNAGATGQLVAMVLLAGTVAAGLLLMALHLAAARASRRAENLEPW